MKKPSEAAERRAAGTVLGVSSRSGAVERAVEVGLLESSIYPPAANFIPGG